MRLLIYADLQASEGSERCRGNPDVSLQQHRVRLFYERLYTVYKKHNCHGLVDLGDTTDDRSAIPVPVIDTVLAGLDRFPTEGENYKITGNHEQFLRDTRIDNSRMFSGHFNVVARSEIELDGCRIIFASYPADHDELAQWLIERAKAHRGPTILFGHFQVVGAAMNSGKALRGIPREVLEAYTLSLLGHVHLPQTLGDTIHYVGSPFQQNWGEAGQPKRVGIVETKDLSVTWIPLNGFPAYRQVDLATFQREYRSDNEDRWKVVLASRAEAERFYALPESADAEPVHAYTAEERGSTLLSASTTVASDPKTLMTAWLRDTADADIENMGISRQDLLEVGIQLVAPDPVP